MAQIRDWLRPRGQQQVEHENQVLWFFLQNSRRSGAEGKAENWRLRPPDAVASPPPEDALDAPEGSGHQQ